MSRGRRRLVGLGDRVDGAEMKSALGWYDERVWINSDHTIRGAIRETLRRPRVPRRGCRPHRSERCPRRVPAVLRVGRDVRATRNAGLTVWLHGADRSGVPRRRTRRRACSGVPTTTPSALTARSSSLRAAASGSCSSAGRIYDAPVTGAHALWGNVLDSYLQPRGRRRRPRDAHDAGPGPRPAVACARGSSTARSCAGTAPVTWSAAEAQQPSPSSCPRARCSCTRTSR